MESLKLFMPIFMNIFRYFLVAGIAYFIFYSWKRQTWLPFKIQKKYPQWKQYKREIAYSVLSGIIFGTLALCILMAKNNGYTLIYTDLGLYGYGYILLSIIALIFIHDTYFYFTHRLMHHPKLFHIFHKVHHQSHNPSPWTAFAFHPLEALVEAAFFPIIVFIMPIHPLAAFVFLFYSMVMNVLGHTGFEYHRKGFVQHWFFKWFNTPTHHNMHHQYSRGNFGLYFNIWDKLMGTNDADYEKRFDEIHKNAHQE